MDLSLNIVKVRLSASMCCGRGETQWMMLLQRLRGDLNTETYSCSASSCVVGSIAGVSLCNRLGLVLVS